MQNNSTAYNTTTVETTPSDKSDNDVNAWKGRLNKEQSSHKETQARLLAEAQARLEAEAKAKEQSERISALEQELNGLKQANTPEIDTDDFSDEELEELELNLGRGAKKLAERLKHREPAVDVNKVIDERLSAERSRLEEQDRDALWQKAVMEQLPDIQGLLMDTAFVNYCQEMEIDFMGNSAIHLINDTAKNRNVGNIPKIRAVIDGFKKQQEGATSTEQITVPPSNKGAAAKPVAKSQKRKMTAKDEVHKRRLMLAGKTDELREFLAKFN